MFQSSRPACCHSSSRSILKANFILYYLVCTRIIAARMRSTGRRTFRILIMSKKFVTSCIAACLLSVVAGVIMAVYWCLRPPAPETASQPASEVGGRFKKTRDLEKARTAEMIVGPFDLTQRYPSMRGPYTRQLIQLGNLLSSKRLVVPESQIKFVGKDDNNDTPMCLGSAGERSSGKSTQSVIDPKRELLWLKGIKLEVLDENDRLLPDAEFICHMNVDVDQAARDAIFPEGQRCQNSRIFTLTQGQTEIVFPDGFAVPAASDEVWLLEFQAANRTTDEHRRVKHRCTFAFVKDSELVYPLKALTWFSPYISVIVDHDTPEARAKEQKDMPDCLGMSYGVTAPNGAPGMIFSDPLKRRLTGHWVVPPGKHTYSSPVTKLYNAGFEADEDRLVHLVWTHVHPLCTSISLSQCGKDRRPLFTAHCKTDVSKGLQLESIETISSEKGILLPKGGRYQMDVSYDNVTKEAYDSMAVIGLFFADNKFVRPDWHLANQAMAFYGLEKKAAAGTTKPSAAPGTMQQAAPGGPGASANAVPEAQQQVFRLFVDAFKFALSKNAPNPQDAQAIAMGMRVTLVGANHKQAHLGALCTGKDEMLIATVKRSPNEMGGILARESTHAQHLRLGGLLPVFLEEGTAHDVGNSYRLHLGLKDNADIASLKQRANALAAITPADAKQALDHSTGSGADQSNKKLIQLNQEVGELFVEYLRNHLTGKGFPDTLERISMIVKQLPKEEKRSDAKWVKDFDSSFKMAFGPSFAEAKAEFLKYIEQTNGKPKLRLDKTKYETFVR